MAIELTMGPCALPGGNVRRRRNRVIKVAADGGTNSAVRLRAPPQAIGIKPEIGHGGDDRCVAPLIVRLVAGLFVSGTSDTVPLVSARVRNLVPIDDGHARILVGIDDPRLAPILALIRLP